MSNVNFSNFCGHSAGRGSKICYSCKKPFEEGLKLIDLLIDFHSSRKQLRQGELHDEIEKLTKKARSFRVTLTNVLYSREVDRRAVSQAKEGIIRIFQIWIIWRAEKVTPQNRHQFDEASELVRGIKEKLGEVVETLDRLIESAPREAAVDTGEIPISQKPTDRVTGLL